MRATASLYGNLRPPFKIVTTFLEFTPEILRRVRGETKWTRILHEVRSDEFSFSRKCLQGTSGIVIDGDRVAFDATIIGICYCWPVVTYG